MLIAASHPFISSLEHIIGFLVVVFALTLLWVITALIGKVFIRMEAATPAPAPVAPVGGDDPPEEEVVALTAVVTAMMGRRSRIVSIRSGAKDWNREGRREHFASHRIR
jgi:Na+-transporting methylmalonyl-CoA/oxaloacetate decarboxylase gamma subunit